MSVSSYMSHADHTRNILLYIHQHVCNMRDQVCYLAWKVDDNGWSSETHPLMTLANDIKMLRDVAFDLEEVRVKLLQKGKTNAA